MVANQTATIPNEIAPELAIVQKAPSLPRSILEMNENQFDRLKILSKVVSDSQLSYAKMGSTKLSALDVMLVMLKGLSLGINEMAALDLIDLIQGKPALKPQGMLALIYNSGEVEYMHFTDENETAIVTVKRRGMPEHIERFSMDDANRMTTNEWVNGQKTTIPLSQKDNWKKQPAVMRKWRAVSAMARVIFSDIIQGMYTTDEVADMIDDSAGKLVTVKAGNNGKGKAQSQPVETPISDVLDQPETKVSENGEPIQETPEPAKAAWATEENLNKLLKSINDKKGDDLTLAQMAGFAGISDALNLDEWNTTFASGKQAGNAITGAYDDMQKELAKLPPATPKGQPEAPIQTKSDLIAAAAAQAEQTSKALNGVPETPKFNPDKAHPILSVTQGRYSNTGRQSFAEFRTEHGPVRLYGMTEALGKVDNLPEGFIENLKAATKFTDLGCMISFQWEMAKNGEYATVKAGTINTDIPF